MLDVLTPLAHEAGDLALSHFRNLGRDAVAEKGPLDLVTIADREVEALVTKRLRQAFPEDGVLGEEGGHTRGTSGRVWIIDPIDGTFNFVRGLDDWAVSIGLMQDGRPVAGIVHAPAMGVTLSGGVDAAPLLNGRPLPPLTGFSRDRALVGVGLGQSVPAPERIEMLRVLMQDLGIVFRHCNATTISLIELATGEVDGHVGYGESAWDVMGAWPVLTALGAVSTVDWARTPLDAKLRFVIGKPELVEACRSLGREAWLSPAAP
ncbi:inositol monophosphatase family protein [Paracoccus tibetensis]|uniref:Inositol-1-monophosphatase n=1 Tax=Paracoccus tibetensis TaxID=336292 RepID=A0A1G5JUK9_9RHOB|nr:inositol monophosphatase family protein [Paracoccus tibetensis]SCY91854.1 myo-inositol-1(or 4)-monophosphatase [Paracoccus tibetensis]